MSALPTCRETTCQGLPALALGLPQGDQLVVALQGAQVLSWQSGGRERLYLSPQSAMDGHTAIRGGVPVCFPQFNQRGPMADKLPKHGFARNLPWQAAAPSLTPGHARLTLALQANAQTLAWWPQAFEAQLHIDLRAGELQLTLDIHNTDAQPLSFSGALHTYLAVADITQAELQGLQGQAEWDAVRDSHAQAAPALRFDGEFDRVYAASTQPLVLNQQLRIVQSASWANTVVWNPAQALCARLADMPEDGWRHMLCVEAAQVFEPISLLAGERWTGWQRLQTLSA